MFILMAFLCDACRLIECERNSGGAATRRGKSELGAKSGAGGDVHQHKLLAASSQNGEKVTNANRFYRRVVL